MATTVFDTTERYERRAQEFADKYGITLTVNHPREVQRYEFMQTFIFPVTLERAGETYSFEFSQPLHLAKTPPTMFQILASLIKEDFYSFQYFCNFFHYDVTNENAEAVYNAYTSCKHQYKNVVRLFSDILDELIQTTKKVKP